MKRIWRSTIGKILSILVGITLYFNVGYYVMRYLESIDIEQPSKLALVMIEILWPVILLALVIWLISPVIWQYVFCGKLFSVIGPFLKGIFENYPHIIVFSVIAFLVICLVKLYAYSAKIPDKAKTPEE